MSPDGLRSEVIDLMHARVRRVVSRVTQLPGGIERHITYWLCYDSAPSGRAGAFFVRCHLADKVGTRVLRESMALSGDLGRAEWAATLTFDLITQAELPVRPENLHYLAQDLYGRALTLASTDYGDLLAATKSSAAALLDKLKGKPVTRPLPIK